MRREDYERIEKAERESFAQRMARMWDRIEQKLAEDEEASSDE